MKLLLLGLFLFFNNAFFNGALANQYWATSNVSARALNNDSNLQLDIDAFKEALYELNTQSSVVMTLPRVGGALEQFKVSQTHVVAQELEDKFPELKTYKIQHVNKLHIRGRMEVMQNKVSAMIKTPQGQELLDIFSTDSQMYRISKKSTATGQHFSCGTKMGNNSDAFSMKLPSNSQYRAPINKLTKLRVAIATTEEYSAEFGTTKTEVLAEIVKAVNRINEVYESDLAITLELVANNDAVIFLGIDSFSNSNASALINESQTQINSLIGSSNYDLGHTFSTGGGGLASVGSVCSNNFKAQGVTGKANPTDDPYWIDYVAHEIGHQLGAEHTFNSTTASCSGSNRAAATAYEPGSGSTIMAYAGICGAENLQSNSDATFHTKSIEQIFNAIPANCGSDVAYSTIHAGDSNPNAPVANAGNDSVIPINTPFVLTATSSDADGDTLLYQWDGADAGTATSSATFGQDLGDNALFRSHLPQTNPARYFPSLLSLLTATIDKAEKLPTTNRPVNFTLKVIDTKGGYASDGLVLTANTSFDGFAITSLSAAPPYIANQSLTISWNAANTTASPVSCPTVEVQLLAISADNSTFSTRVIASAKANSGAALITLPDENSSKSRFLVKCENNVFFAINDADFSISGSATNTAASNTDQSTSSGDQSKFTSNASSGSAVASTGGGGGSFSAWLIFLLSAIFVTRRSV